MQKVELSNTLTFIRQNYQTALIHYGETLIEEPIKQLRGLVSSEGLINPSEISKAIYVTLDYFATSSCEFIQPNFSTVLTVEELLSKIQKNSGLWDFLIFQDGKLKKFHREDNRDNEFTVTVVYPWMLKRKTLYMFRQLAKHGSFVLGVDRLVYDSL